MRCRCCVGDLGENKDEEILERSHVSLAETTVVDGAVAAFNDNSSGARK